MFKAYAQNQVDLATSKSVKEKLADRFQLKVALSRREQWEGAVEEADMFLNKSAMDRKIYFSQKLMSANKKSSNKSEYLYVLLDFANSYGKLIHFILNIMQIGKIDENKKYRGIDYTIKKIKYTII